MTPYVLSIPHVLALKHTKEGTATYDEITARGMEAVLLAFREFDPSKDAELVTFVYWKVRGVVWRVLHTKSLVRWRKIPSLPPHLEAESNERGAQKAAAADALALIEKALEPVDWKVLWLRYAENCSLEEIGQELGFSHQRARVRLARAEQRARAEAARRGLCEAA